MTVIYDQSGLLTVGGVEFTAYSGNGEGLNNPDMEAAEGVGPIPRGQWHVVEWVDNYENKGSCVARLAPVGFDPHGRSGFLCHGDNPELNHTASDGCIVAPHDARTAWRNSEDNDLEVT